MVNYSYLVNYSHFNRVNLEFTSSRKPFVNHLGSLGFRFNFIALPVKFVDFQ